MQYLRLVVDSVTLWFIVMRSIPTRDLYHRNSSCTNIYRHCEGEQPNRFTTQSEGSITVPAKNTNQSVLLHLFE